MEEPLKAIEYIQKNSREYAQAKAQRVLIENSLKSVKSELIGQSDAKTFGDREAEAYAHPTYKQQLAGLAQAVETEEYLRYMLEAAKLNAQLPALRAFERLLQTLEGTGHKGIHWDPQLGEKISVQTLTLSPTLQMNRDDSQLLAAIELIRKELTGNPVRYDLLMNYILKRAAEEGYLEEIHEELDETSP